MSAAASLPAPVREAALWLAFEKNPPRPLLPNIMSKFGLTAKQAIDAEREALLIKARAH